MNIPDNMTPPEWDLLLSAAQKNQPNRIREMCVDGGVDPSHANAVGQSALHIAVLWGHVESVKALLECGANVLAQNSMNGASPLHMLVQFRKASLEKRLEVADLLLAAGADPNQQDSHGNPPQFYAVERDDDIDAELVQRLQPKTSPFIVSIQDGALKSVQQQLLLEEENAETTLVSKIHAGHLPLQICVSCLITATNEPDSLETASIQLNILKVLLTAGSSANVGNEKADEQEDLPPLHRVCCALRNSYKQDGDNKEPSVTSKLLQETAVTLVTAGAVVHADTVQLLHDAARRDHVNMAEFLVETLHVDPNTRGRQGMTPLQFAARSGRMNVLNYLLQQSNIDTSLADDGGKTALDAAKVNGHDGIVQALEAHLAQK